MENQKLFEESSKAVKMSSDIIEQCSGLRYLWSILLNAETDGPAPDPSDCVQMAVLMGNALDIIEEANGGIYKVVENVCCDTGLVEHQGKHGLKVDLTKPVGALDNIQNWGCVIQNLADSLNLAEDALENDDDKIRNGAFNVLYSTTKEIRRAGDAIEQLCLNIKQGKQERTDILSPV